MPNAGLQSAQTVLYSCGSAVVERRNILSTIPSAYTQAKMAQKLYIGKATVCTQNVPDFTATLSPLKILELPLLNNHLSPQYTGPIVTTTNIFKEN